MPSFPSRIAVFLCATILAACSGNPEPPTGRWQGVHADSRLIVVVRLEIAADGVVRVAAPNAIGMFDAMSEDERAAMLARLDGEAARTWQAVPPMLLDFDGKDFRKPGGVAPQFQWDAERRRMTMIYYAGNRPSVRVPLDSVSEFDKS